MKFCGKERKDRFWNHSGFFKKYLELDHAENHVWFTNDFNNNLIISVFRIYWDTRFLLFIFFYQHYYCWPVSTTMLCYCFFLPLKFILCKERESNARVLLLIPLWSSAVQFICFILLPENHARKTAKCVPSCISS